jgi:ABC-type multidrug transport system fused ATPase/permease subunit
LKKILYNILTILNHHERQKLFRLAILDIFISLLDIFFLVALLFVIHFYTQPTLSRFSANVNFKLLNEHPLLLIIIFFLLFSIKNLFGFIIFKMQYNFVYAVASRISGDNLLHYLEGSYHDYVQVDSSVSNRKISQQPIEFCHYVLNGIQQIFSQLVLIFISIIAILIYNPLLFLLLLLILVPPVFLIAFLMKKKLSSVRLYSKKTSEKTIQHLQEALSGFVESNVYGKNDFFKNRYHSFQARLNHYLAENQVIQHMPSRLIEVFAVFGLFVLILLSSFTAGIHAIPIVTIGAFMAAAYKIIPGIVKIMNMMGQVKTYSFTVTDLLNKRQSFQQKTEINTTIHSVVFENVCFSYPGKKILDSFSLNIEKGDLAGISGMSGKGKTTIANLLLGFLSPGSGNIFINDVKCNAEERQAYWNKISYIKQQPFFIHDSILKNIVLQEAAHDKDKWTKVLAVTGVDKLLEITSGGSETIITENGKNFSGGQRQRVIFARALYKEFDLIILDEPFNELDESSEITMLKQLQQIAGEGKIVILITHNKTALSFCNKKIMMDEQ